MKNSDISAPTVLVLLSTYNGERFLPEQLESLQKQKNVDLHILIRDDSSTDNTVKYLEDYCADHSNTTFYCGENKRPAQSFLNLINNAPDYDYYALCDQDDVWDEDKIIIAIKMLSGLDLDKPCMYYSNIRIVDSKLNYMRNSHSIPQVQKNKYCCLVEPMPTGCTMVFNKKTRDMIQGRIPEYCSMHDSWIYMVCQIFGNTIYDFDAHMSYRQHENNVIGAYNGGIKKLIERIKRLFDRNLQPRYKNAVNFLKCYQDLLNDIDLVKVNEVAHYKDSLHAKLKLLFDRDLSATTTSRELRNKVLILLELL